VAPPGRRFSAGQNEHSSSSSRTSTDPASGLSWRWEPTASSQRKRVDAKVRRGEIKAARRRIIDD